MDELQKEQHENNSSVGSQVTEEVSLSTNGREEKPIRGRVGTKIRRWLLGLLLAPILLIVLLIVLLYIPPIQRFVVGIVEEKVESATGMDLEIGALRLKFPLNLSLKSIQVVTAEGDTLLRLGHLETSVPLMPLFNGQIETRYLAVRDVRVFFPDSARTTIMKADARNIEVGPLSVNLRKENVDVGALLFEEGSFSLFSVDTVPNPNPEPVLWKIAVNRVDLVKSRLHIEMPFTQLFVDAQIDKGEVDELSYDIGTLRLEGRHVSLRASEASYAQDTIYSTVPFVDYTHLYARDLEIKGSKLVQQNTLLRADIEHARFRERSGASVTDFRGAFFMEDGLIELEDFSLLTPYTRASGSFRLPLSIFTEGDETSLIKAQLKGSLGYEDIFYFSTFDISQYIGGKYPILDTPIDFAIEAEGTVKHLDIETFALSLPEIVELQLKGQVGEFFAPQKLLADLSVNVKAQRKAYLLYPLMGSGLKGRFAFPEAMNFQGKVNISNGRYALKSQLQTRKDGKISLDALYSLPQEAYNITLNSTQLNVRSFLPKDSIGTVSMALKMQGAGFDVMSPKTFASADLDVYQLNYNGVILSDITLDLSLKSGALALKMDSHNPGASVVMNLDALLQDALLKGDLDVHLDTLSLARLGFVADTLDLGGHFCGTFSTDWKTSHSLLLEVNDIFLKMPNTFYSYDSLALRARTTPDTVLATLSAGDLFFDAYIGGGIDSIAATASRISELTPSLQVDSLLPSTVATMLDALPPIGLDIYFHKDNPLKEILAPYKMSIDRGEILFSNVRNRGLDLEANIYNFRHDTLKIDQLYASISTEKGIERTSLSEAVYDALSGFTWPDTQPIRAVKRPGEGELLDKYLRADIRANKKRYRNQEPFNFYLRALSDFRTVDITTHLLQEGEEAYSLEAILFKNASGYGLTFKDTPIIVAGYQLNPNPHNALFFNPTQKELWANLTLTSLQDAKLSLHSLEDENAKNTRRLSMNLQRLQLSDIAHLLGKTTIEGYMFADLRLEIDPTYDLPRVVGDISINDLTYDASRVGNISIATFYEPRDNTRHFVDAYVSVDGNLALVAEGQYHSEDKEMPLNLKAQIENFPLSLANPFIGANLASLQGEVKGNLSAKGTFDNILLNGELIPEGATFYLPMVGNTFAITTPPIRFLDSKLLFDNLQLSNADAQQPFVVDGYLTLLGPEALTTDLSVRGQDVQLINSKYKRGQLLYGKLLTSVDLSVRGNVMKPRVRGEVDILGGTNVTYVYTQSAIQAKDRLSDVVTFTDFSDTVDTWERQRHPISLGGMDLTLHINVAPSVRLSVDLSPDHQDYVTVMGGGDLHFVYPPFGEMSLTGRYNLQGGGDVRYNFPVVGRKDFVIDPDSYIQWNGSVTNPYIDFVAKQRVRANVTEGGATRKVNFDVEIVAKETVDKIDLGFDLSAPEDLSLQGKLATMSKEERGKQALGLMLTGTFLASDATPTNMQKMLSGLAVSELNSLTGKLLQGTDLDLGMELHDAAESGRAYTDYTYNFSRRFYNDRLRFSVGGRVGTGNLPTNYEQTFIDNLSLEYQLDRSGRQYVRLFHKRNNDHLLEGLVTETGVGYVLRRKLNNLLELFKKEAKKKRVVKSISPTEQNQTTSSPTEQVDKDEQ